MLTRFLEASLAAAVIAGLTFGFLQANITTPLILAAETIETMNAEKSNEEKLQFSRKSSERGLYATPQGAVTSNIQLAHAGHLNEIPGHQHTTDGQSLWLSHADATVHTHEGISTQRLAYSIAASVGIAFGYAIILLAIMSLLGIQITARSGLIWGIGGFAAFGLAPALGVAPTLPSMEGIAFSAHQIWYLSTGIATAVGIYLCAINNKAIIPGLLLIAIPHIIGAPTAQVEVAALGTVVAPEIAGQFVASSLALQAVMWALCGWVAGYIWERRSRLMTATA